MKAGAFRRITVAVDGSPPAEAGVALALRIAGEDTTLCLCSVVDPASTYGLTDAALGPPPSLAELRAAAWTICDDGVRQARERGLSAHAAVIDGRPADGVLRCAQQHESDAIVMGSHGRKGIVRAAVGSIAEEVIRQSPFPVAIAHVGDHLGRGSIAVAIDGSAAAAAALDTAIALAHADGRTLSLFHVFSRDDLDRLDALGQGSTARDEASRRQAEGVLENALGLARSRGVACTSLMLEGHPAAELLAALDRDECAAVVVGTHGRSELARLFFGSVAAALVERARVPVVVCKKEEPEVS